MSGMDFLRAFTQQALSDRQRAQQEEWARQRQQQQFDLLKQQVVFRQALEERATPPQMVQFRGEDGGLMQQLQRWNTNNQAVDTFGEATPVPVTPTGKVQKFRDGDRDVMRERMSDGSWEDRSAGRAFAPVSDQQTANSIALDRRAEQRRLDSAQQAAVNAVNDMELNHKGKQKIAELGGRAAAIEALRSEYLYDGGDMPEPGLMGGGGGPSTRGGARRPAPRVPDPEITATDEAGKATAVTSEEAAIAKVVDSPEFKRAPTGKEFDIQGKQWVKTDRGLEPKGESDTKPAVDQAITEAKAAIKRGAPREAVLQRLKEKFPNETFAGL